MTDFWGANSYSSLTSEFNINTLAPASGFASGIRVVKNWEELILSFVQEDEFHELQLIDNWNLKTTSLYSNLRSSRYAEFYRSEKRLVPEDKYENTLIKQFGSNNFRKTDAFLTIKTVADLTLLLSTPRTN